MDGMALRQVSFVAGKVHWAVLGGNFDNPNVLGNLIFGLDV